MARAHAQIFTSIWNDEDFRALTPEAQHLYLFLLSQPDLNYAGVLAFLPKRWELLAAGWSVEAIDKALAELEAAWFVAVDRDAYELLIRSLIRNDRVYRQPNVFRAACRAISGTLSRTLRGILHGELERIPLAELTESVRTKVRDEMTPLVKTLPDPIFKPGTEPFTEGFGEPFGEPQEEGQTEPHPEGFTEGSGEGEGVGVGSKGSVRTTSVSALKSAKTPASKSSRVPDPFPKSEALSVWFAKDCPDVDLQFEHAKFMDYWRGVAGAKGRKDDWPATWRNWMRKAQNDLVNAGRAPKAAAAARRNGTPVTTTAKPMVDSGHLPVSAEAWGLPHLADADE